MIDQTKYSECCEAPLRKYNKDWNDGICRKCEKHSMRGEKMKRICYLVIMMWLKILLYTF